MAAKAGARRDPYVGEVINQLRDGYGIYNYDNKFFRYEGEWKSGRKNGHGKLLLADGGYYEGEFKDGEIEGHGFRLFGLTGNKYSGQFHMGEMHGQGVMTYSAGEVYEGQWFRNNKQGYGILHGKDNSIYQGNIHLNKRHGEGTQLYSNGDRYDGDWVLDKRQGHGELKMNDGSRYDGQWANDLYNGQGTMEHSSGVIYEGLWINGKPINMATRLEIRVTPSDLDTSANGGLQTEEPLEVIQGTTFQLEVVCVNDSGDLIPEEGRTLQLTAGFKYQPASTEHKSGLFDVIEDVEEKPIPTPFGYDIVSYPITDQLKPEDLFNLDMGQRSKTMLSEAIAEHAETNEEGEEERAEGQGEEDTEETGQAASDQAQAVETGETEDPQDTQEADVLPGIPLTLPVESRRTHAGSATFSNLVLTAAPPMYRPFLLLAEEERAKQKSRAGKKPDEKHKRMKETSESSEQDSEIIPENGKEKKSGKRSKQNKKEGERSAKNKNNGEDIPRPGTKTSKRDKLQVGDEKFAKPGEYVIMVRDVTLPQFLDVILEPAFLKVKVILPKKVKKPIKKKDKGPRWDTSIHISQSMARGYTQVAEEEMQKAFAGITSE